MIRSGFAGAVILALLVLTGFVPLGAIAGFTPPNAPVDLRAGGFAAGTPESDRVPGLTPVISWVFSDPDLGNAQKAYDVRVSTGAGGTGSLLWTCVAISSNSWTQYGVSCSGATALDYGGSYHAQVATQDNSGLWGPLAEFSFAINVPPEIPGRPIAPIDDSTVGRTDRQTVDLIKALNHAGLLKAELRSK